MDLYFYSHQQMAQNDLQHLPAPPREKVIPFEHEIAFVPSADACVFLVFMPLNQLELDLDSISYFDTFCSTFSGALLEVLHKHRLTLNQQLFI